MKNSTCDVYVLCEGIDEPVWIKNIDEFLYKVLSERKHENWELSVLFCSDPYMAELNKEYRQKDGSTDVLSFEQGEEYIDDDGKLQYIAGDIAISVDFLYNNAKEFNISPDEELKRLLIHGILHLEGYDHGDAHIGEETNEMFELQESLLQSFQDYKIIG